MRFEFATATRIVFGPGALSEVGPAAIAFGRRALVVTGRASPRAQSILALLATHGIEAIHFPTIGEPTVDLVRAGTSHARKERCGLVIGFGGGSALDAAKAIAAMLANPGDPLDYIEVIGKGRPLTQPSAPFIAIPTTAGTGTEVTRNAVLSSPEHKVKASLRSSLILARLAVVDPELTYALPTELTACTGLDALTQLIEPFVSPRANPVTDALCREGMLCAARSLRRACECGSDTAARQDMALASLLSGLALANAGLGAVHGLAAPLGGAFSAPHGAICAALLPHVMAINAQLLRQTQPANPALLRYAEIARILTGNPNAEAQDGVCWINQLSRALRIPRLAAFGINKDSFGQLAAKAASASSMRGNPVLLSPKVLREILAQAT
jgi:alcohol dehydrogenase class IV